MLKKAATVACLCAGAVFAGEPTYSQYSDSKCATVKSGDDKPYDYTWKNGPTTNSICEIHADQPTKSYQNTLTCDTAGGLTVVMTYKLCGTTTCTSCSAYDVYKYTVAEFAKYATTNTCHSYKSDKKNGNLYGKNVFSAAPVNLKNPCDGLTTNPTANPTMNPTSTSGRVSARAGVPLLAIAGTILALL